MPTTVQARARRRSSLLTSLAILLIATASAPGSLAATWRVAQDGSGDFDNLLAAADAVASGDTVFVAAGVYDSTVSFAGAAGTRTTCFPVRVEELTIIGESRDDVLIGPLVRVPITAVEPQSIFGGTNSVRLDVSNLTVRNAAAGINTPAGGRIEGVRILQTRYGLVNNGAIELEVADCDFELNSSSYAAFGAVRPTIDNSVFAGAPGASLSVNFVNTVGASVVNCSFPIGRVGVQFEQGSTGGLVRGCTFGMLESASISLYAFSDALVTQSRMEGSLWGVVIFIDQLSSLTVLRSYIGEGADYAAIHTASPVELRVNECNIFAGAGYAIRTDSGRLESSTIDMRNNYWGTTDEAEIQSQIWDIHDDPTTLATVLYLPFADSSVATRRESIGGLKAQFQRQE